MVRYDSIRCADCGKVLGRFPVFSIGDSEDGGEPECNEDFGAFYDGEYYCRDCVGDHMDPEEDWELAMRLDTSWFQRVLDGGARGGVLPMVLGGVSGDEPVSGRVVA
ncbi:MAG: hypothetical protein LBD78_04065 [Spirochaetaceae bacterium]|jgi:hypothetical protein|nr:hypothetical protein [Spirochaetaceae bacterium]